MTERKAVSPVLATLILIVMAIGIGLALWAWVSGYIGGAKVTDFAITDAHAYNDTGRLVITIKNTATIAIAKLTVFFDGADVTAQGGWTPAVAAGNPLAPGASATFRADLTAVPGGTGALGTRHLIEVQAEYVDGSVITRSVQIFTE